MKRLLFVVLVGFGLTVVAQDTEPDPQNGPIITFSESIHDFGAIEQGEIVEHIFKFENTGSEPLILTGVRTTCGCTAPSWPKEPVAPGESSEILVRFNSRGKAGLQNKVITVSSNAQNATERISIRTQVNVPSSDDSGN